MTTSLRMLSNGNQLFIGIALGIFLGLCISMFDDDYLLTVNIHTPDPFFNILPSQLIKQRRKQQNLTLRCIVLLTSGERQKPEKEFSAIIDTWGRDCKECNRLCGVQSTNYVTSWWEKIILFYKINARGVPQHTGRTIGGCAIQMGIALLDPIDEVSLNSTILQINECCSDRAIAFGLLNHKDQRLLDFGVRRLKVFGKDRL
uniref:Uncharacterized protein n=1 Tax=Meloidogyne javanica TaxID=6303 RepID=A0A915MCJ2_MELJA